MDPTQVIPEPTNWYAAIAYGVAVFMAVSLGINKYLDMRGGHNVTINALKEDLARQVERAKIAEERSEQAWTKVNSLVQEQSDIKAQNLLMIEQIRTLREENQELKAKVETFMRTHNG